jgi:RNA polymerase sigma factor (sigma-70 family)
VTRLGREPSALQDGVASAMNAGPNSDALRAALAELAPRDRDLLLLFGCIGLSYAEIGEALSLPLGTVRSRIHRLRHKLRGRLSLQSEEASADVR